MRLSDLRPGLGLHGRFRASGGRLSRASRVGGAGASRVCLVAALVLTGCRSGASEDRAERRGPPPPSGPVLTFQQSGTTELLQAVSPVDANVVWVSGHGATFARTTDGGSTWQASVVPDVGPLQFRDVHGFDAQTAVLMSAGTGDQSRIYRTEDGGATWSERWVNDEPEGFYDCIDFWDDRRGAAYGDAIGGELRILLTDDGGRTWRRLAGTDLPPARDGEGGFAASGTCLVAGPDGLGWVAAGNAVGARVFRTEDFGRSWSAHEAPVVSGSGAGLTSIAMEDAAIGLAFGGDLAVREEHTDNVVRTSDGGRTWSLTTRPALVGAVYGGVFVPGSDGAYVIVGPAGADVSLDRGSTWEPLDTSEWWGVGAYAADAIWLAGRDGRIARLAIP